MRAGKIVKIVMIVATLAALGVFLWLFTYYAWHRGQPEPLTNPNRQGQIPAAVHTPTTSPTKDWFASVVWLSPQESTQLRSKADVVNFALLQNGGVYYARDFGIPLDMSRWEKALNANQFVAASVEGTGVHFSLISGSEYDLNVLEPFVLADNVQHSTTPPVVWMFDQSGQLWEITNSQPTSLLVPLNQVVAQLPITVAANPNLTFTTGR